LRYILPFVTTPANIFATGIKKSPLGTLGLPMKMYRNYQEGRHVLYGLPADVAQQVLAWALVLALLSNDEDDPWITGAEPESTYEKRQVGYRTTPAMSVKIGGNWHSYSRLEPFATVLGLTVDFVNAIRSGDTARQVDVPITSLKGQIGSKTFLSGVADIFDAVQERSPSEGIARWSSNFTTSWVPNIVRGAGRESSDYYENRRVWGTRAEWFKRLGKRTIQKTELSAFQEYPIYDVWGRPATRSETGMGPATDWVYRITIPSRIQDDETFVADRVILNYNLQNPEDERFPLAPVPYYTDKGKTVYMTDGQYAELSKLTGETARAALDKTPFVTDKPTLEAVEWINDACADARAIVRDRLKKRWSGEEIAIDPLQLGTEIQQSMKQSLVHSLPYAEPKRKADVSEKDHTIALKTFKEKRAKVKRKMDMLGIFHTQAQQLLVEYHRRRDAEGKVRMSEKGKILTEANQRPSVKIPLDESYSKAALALAELYGYPPQTPETPKNVKTAEKAWEEFYDSPEFLKWDTEWWAKTTALLPK